MVIWRLWSADGIIRSKQKLSTFQYNSVAKALSLSPKQLPLLASLVGNDVTESLNRKLDKFFKRFDRTQHKIRNVAQFIRTNCHNIDCQRISRDKIQQIVQQIFNASHSERVELIKTSIESYNVNIPPNCIVDPIERKLQNTDMYASYVENMFHIQSLNLQSYDLYGDDLMPNLPDLLTSWVKCRKGVLMKNAKNPLNTFTLLVKKNANVKYDEYEESLTNPTGEVMAFRFNTFK